MSFLHLANELLLMIAQNFELSRNFYPKDLYSLALVNRRLAYLLIPLLHEEAFKDKCRYTALQWAVLTGDMSLLRFLLDHGADVNYCERKIESITPFNGTRTPAVTDPEYPALLLAAQHGQGEMVKLLIQNGANGSLVGPLGESALHVFALNGDEATVLALLQDGITDPLVRNYQGLPAFHIAARSGRKALVKLFLDRGTDAELLDGSNCTALNRAVFGLRMYTSPERKREYEETIKLLLDASREMYDQESIDMVLDWGPKRPIGVLIRGRWDVMCQNIRRWGPLHRS